MEIDVAASLWAESEERITKAINGVKPTPRGKPIHRQALSGVTITPAVAPAFAYVEIVPHVAAGRVWNVLEVNLMGADAHTPVLLQGISGIQSSGSSAAPAANTQVSGLTPVINYPVGTTFLVSWTVTTSGTTAVADASNFKVMYSSQNIVSVVPNPQTGTLSGQIYYTTTLAGGTFHVNNIGAATAGTVYGASISAVPVSGPVLGNSVLPGTWADIYAGALLPDLTIVGAPSLVISDIIAAQQAIPAIVFVPDKAVWLHQDDTVYALVYNPPANQQLTLTARVAEYKVEDVETLSIP